MSFQNKDRRTNESFRIVNRNLLSSNSNNNNNKFLTHIFSVRSMKKLEKELILYYTIEYTAQ